MSKPTFAKPRFEPGATVLVTGATGLVGSNIAEQLLIAGYKVRVITRSALRAQPLKAHLESQYGKDTVGIVELADATEAKALDQAVQGVSGIVHAATDASMSSNPDVVIGNVVKSTKSLLEAAARNPEVKSVVLTSSSVAAFTTKEPQPIRITEETYTDSVVDYAYAVPDSEPSKPALVYMASKVKGERGAWEAAKGAHYAFNTVLPNFVTGPPANPDRSSHAPGYTTFGWLREFAQGDYGPHTTLYLFLHDAAGLFNDVRDVARAHVAALVAEEVQNQRIFAMTDLFCVEEVASSIRKAKPNLKLPSVAGSADRMDLSVPNQYYKDLLKQYYGTAPISLEQSVADSIADL